MTEEAVNVENKNGKEKTLVFLGGFLNEDNVNTLHPPLHNNYTSHFYFSGFYYIDIILFPKKKKLWSQCLCKQVTEQREQGRAQRQP